MARLITRAYTSVTSAKKMSYKTKILVLSYLKQANCIKLKILNK